MRLLVDIYGIRLGRGLGHRGPHVLLYQPHAPAGGAGDLAGAALRAAAAAAHADHLPDQCAASRPRAQAAGSPSDAYLASVSMIDERDGRRVRMGHLAFIGSHRVNGVSALHTELMKHDGVPRPAPALSGPHRQQDQRHHLPPLAAPGQSAADRAARRDLRRRACSTTSTLIRDFDKSADDAGAAGGGRGDPAGQQDRARAADPRLARDARSTRARCSTCRSSASTNTSASCSTCSRRSRSTTRSAPSRRATGRRA